LLVWFATVICLAGDNALPQAILHVGGQQNVSYAVSLDASQSKGMNPISERNIFSTKT
jgi:hypothetical protein